MKKTLLTLLAVAGTVVLTQAQTIQSGSYNTKGSVRSNGTIENSSATAPLATSRLMGRLKMPAIALSAT